MALQGPRICGSEAQDSGMGIGQPGVGACWAPLRVSCTLGVGIGIADLDRYGLPAARGSCSGRVCTDFGWPRCRSVLQRRVSPFPSMLRELHVSGMRKSACGMGVALPMGYWPISHGYCQLGNIVVCRGCPGCPRLPKVAQGWTGCPCCTSYPGCPGCPGCPRLPQAVQVVQVAQVA